MQGLGGTGAQQSQDCSFPAGSVAGAPLRISWFLVIFFAYQVLEEAHKQQDPLWVRLVRVCGNEALLLFTVLCHEMGHGTMARWCGGTIAEVLLWPFGGICFTTRPSGRTSKQKLVDDLWIVGAGPLTHFPMTAAWCGILAAFLAVYSEVVAPEAWEHIVPFTARMSPCFDATGRMAQCFHDWPSLLAYSFFTQAIQLNVMLFMFNVFFPMYPMDGAKLIVCSLQLFCCCPARTAAKVLIGTSTPLAIFFIGMSLKGSLGGGLQPGLSLYMGIMCLGESFKIYKLLKEDRLHTHPLFELARSSTREVNDGSGITTRLNFSDHDDEESAPRAPEVPYSQPKPFANEGQGRKLGGEAPAATAATTSPTTREPLPGSQGGAAQETETSAAARAAWLDRMQEQTAERQKTVRQLEEEKLQRKPPAA